LRVKFSSRGTIDLDDDDQINYQWLFDGKTVGSTEPNPTYTYTQNGIFNAILKVTDQHGAVGADTIIIKVGNKLPVVTINTPGNKSFFWEGKPFEYEVTAIDKEDGKIDPKEIQVYFDYNPQPSKLTAEGENRREIITTVETHTVGKNLIASSDCKACHTIDKVSVGPSYTAVSMRYKNQPGAVEMLAQKIIDGGGGNWGTTYITPRFLWKMPKKW
jgi:cytochrome c